jgi:prepilin-type N-terminal cleavage/methylation domain-containing protein
MKRHGFTLIELLIVVAIIAILAAIAVPNFLEAQTRSKVSRVKADQRSIATGLEAYRVDYNNYVPAWNDTAFVSTLPGGAAVQLFVRWRLVALTTPVAYLSSLPDTPFDPKYYQHSSGSLPLSAENKSSEYNNMGIGVYNNVGMVAAGSRPGVTKWHLRDCGADNNFNNVNSMLAYDPSNGTVSAGDIYRFGP